MKRTDWMLVAVFLAIAIAFIGYRAISAAQDAASVVVIVDGETRGIYYLSEEQEIAIDDTNHFIIEDGKAKMDFATCPDQYCVHQKAISKNGESIICLPNKVIVEIRSSKSADLDAVAK